MAYSRVLAAALLCYAALGAILRVLPSHLTELGAGPAAVGLAVGAPAITGLVARPGGGRLADRVGPRAVLPPAAAQERDGAGLFGATLRPGVGLMLVNVGYAAVLAFGGGRSPLVVPAFAVTVIAVRTAGAGIPDRFGARATLAAAAPLAAAGLVVVAVVPGAALLGVVTLGAGQALAVPALGLLALARIPPARHGVAAGLFFSWFDAGVGLGGPAAGILAQIGGPTGALIGAAIAVACTAPLTLISTIRPPWEPLVN
jgi:MFS family permease